MGGLSIWHWIIVGGVAFILFGGNFKISDVMGDVAKGIKAFKKGLAEDDDAKPDAEAPAEDAGPSAARERMPQTMTVHDKPVDAQEGLSGDAFFSRPQLPQVSDRDHVRSRSPAS